MYGTKSILDKLCEADSSHLGFKLRKSESSLSPKSKIFNCLYSIHIPVHVSLYLGQENPIRSLVLNFLSGTACPVYTSGTILLCLLQGRVQEHNLLPVV